MRSRLTTTSYALLGLLRRGPFSAYELTAHMRRSALGHLWPRTEASLYREPKNLVAHGLATADEQHRGGRARTVYSITPAGRRALRAWLAEPAEGWQFESEAAVKVFFADAGSLDALRANLAGLAEYKPQQDPPAPELIDRWLAGDMRFPEHVQYTAMAADLIGRLNDAVAGWAADWHAGTAEWRGTALHDASEAQARRTLRRLRRGFDQASRRPAPVTARDRRG